ncbi:MAG TPA: ribosome maturation factor RimM [Longimicrobiales bacterium]|nr:ribosome maturation factor RimM [Longimicrobiales bacterium]
MTADTGERALPEHLVVGHITKAHGTKGELFVWPLTDRPDKVFAPGNELLLGDEDGVLDESAPVIVVETVRPFKRGLLVKLDQFESREDADELAQRYVLLPTEAVPPLDEGEVFYHDLLGMTVVTVSGDVVGTVREVFETDPHHLLEVKSDAGKLHLIPFAERIVRSVDVAAQRMVIDPPEGLLEL